MMEDCSGLMASGSSIILEEMSIDSDVKKLVLNLDVFYEKNLKPSRDVAHINGESFLKDSTQKKKSSKKRKKNKSKKEHLSKIKQESFKHGGDFVKHSIGDEEIQDPT